MVTCAIAAIKDTYDPRFGGFGRAPVSRPSNLSRARSSRPSQDRDGIGMVTHTCDQMAAGGIYDQLGGGRFFSVDERWLVPHLKMLYDNAQLIHLYLDTSRQPEKRHAAVVRDVMRYLAREYPMAAGIPPRMPM